MTSSPHGSLTFKLARLLWKTDPAGLPWGVASHKEDLTPEEMGKRAAEWFANMGGPDCPSQD